MTTRSPVPRHRVRRPRLDLGEIVARARTPWERLAVGAAAAETVDVEAAAAWLSRWRAHVAGGDAETFARRLAWDGVDERAMEAVLGGVRVDAGARPPAWARVVARASSAARRMARSPAPAGDAEENPYAALAAPFVAVARARLARSPHRARMAAAAHAECERTLLLRLAGWLERAAHAAFTAQRGERPGLAWDAWVRETLGDGFAAFFARYPVLARLLGQGVADWVAAAAELLARLAADAGEIGAVLGGGGDPGVVVEAVTGASDPHAGGRTVALLRFESGVRAVYKPRPLDAEAIFARVAAWLNGVCPGPALRPLRVLPRGGYGWTAFVEAGPCGGSDEVERHRERAGRLLALAYLLGARDLHAENLLAAGEHPVLIDLEVLLHPRRAGGAPEDPAGAGGRPHESVLATSLLPRLHTRPDGGARCTGGLVPTRVAPGHTNVPVLDGAPAPGDPTAAVERGFRDACRAVMEHRGALLAPGGPLADAGRVRTRVVLRATTLYTALLQRSLTPRLLEDAAARAVELDVLARPLLRGATPPPVWPAVPAETRAVERMDVPVFHVPARGTALEAGGRRIGGFAAESGVARMEARIRALDAAQVQRQAHCIRVSFAAHGLRREWAAAAVAEDAAGASLGAAREIGRWVERLAVTRGGAPAWAAEGPAGVELAAAGLAHGTAGIGLFCAAHAAVTGDGTLRALAHRTLEPLARRVDDPAALAEAGVEGTGVEGGTAGVLYALLRAGVLLGDARLVDAAVRAGRAMLPATLPSGAERELPGTLLVLLGLHRASGDEQILAQALEFGRVVVKRLDEEGAGPAEAPLAALALARLHAAAPAPPLRAAAARALEGTPAADAVRAGWAAAVAWCEAARLLGRPHRVETLVQAALAGAGAGTALAQGAMGRAELLLHAGLALGNAGSVEEARRAGRDEAVGAVRRGTFLAGTAECALAPGLLDGIAGIGYQHLRLHHPRLLPSLLLLD